MSRLGGVVIGLSLGVACEWTASVFHPRSVAPSERFEAVIELDTANVDALPQGESSLWLCLSTSTPDWPIKKASFEGSQGSGKLKASGALSDGALSMDRHAVHQCFSGPTGSWTRGDTAKIRVSVSAPSEPRLARLTWRLGYGLPEQMADPARSVATSSWISVVTAGQIGPAAMEPSDWPPLPTDVERVHWRFSGDVEALETAFGPDLEGFYEDWSGKGLQKLLGYWTGTASLDPQYLELHARLQAGTVQEGDAELVKQLVKQGLAGSPLGEEICYAQVMATEPRARQPLAQNCQRSALSRDSVALFASAIVTSGAGNPERLCALAWDAAVSPEVAGVVTSRCTRHPPELGPRRIQAFERAGFVTTTAGLADLSRRLEVGYDAFPSEGLWQALDSDLVDAAYGEVVTDQLMATDAGSRLLFFGGHAALARGQAGRAKVLFEACGESCGRYGLRSQSQSWLERLSLPGEEDLLVVAYRIGRSAAGAEPGEGSDWRLQLESSLGQSGTAEWSYARVAQGFWQTGHSGVALEMAERLVSSAAGKEGRGLGAFLRLANGAITVGACNDAWLAAKGTPSETSVRHACSTKLAMWVPPTQTREAYEASLMRLLRDRPRLTARASVEHQSSVYRLLTDERYTGAVADEAALFLADQRADIGTSMRAIELFLLCAEYCRLEEHRTVACTRSGSFVRAGGVVLEKQAHARLCADL